MNALTDDSPMPFGKYKGTRMEDVPANYLLWLHNQNCQHVEVAQYIRENLTALAMECPDIIIEE